MVKVRKHTLTVVVFTPEDHPLTDVYGLEDIAREIGEGDWIGGVDLVKSEDVPEDKLRAELLAVGNDGEFFDYPGNDGEPIGMEES